MRSRRPGIAFLAGLSLLAGAFTSAWGDEPAVSNQQISASITKSVAWIYQQQNEFGTWEADQEPAGSQRDLVDQGQFGFKTALAVRTLIAAGENERDPRIQKAVDFLVSSNKITGVYAIGMRAFVLPSLDPTPVIHQQMADDLRTLVSAMHARGRTHGLYSFRTDYTDYPNEPEYADHSVSFYGAMGVKALADAGLEVPPDYWLAVQHAWRTQQMKDGSWVFDISPTAKQEKTMAMTAAGVAVLYAMDDELAALKPADCRPLPADRYIDPGLTWIDSNFDQSREPHDIGGVTLRNYALYAIARIGIVSGRKYFGNRDWYQDGARMLLSSQTVGGGWENLPDTCFAVLFLTRGRNPVLFNKLQYEIIPPQRPTARQGAARRGPAPPPPSGPPKAANWNLRPRDMSSLSEWIGRQSEREFNWQTVDLKGSVDELHDSSILYIAGNQPLNLTMPDRDKIKRFIEEGGTVVGNADCANRDFSDGFRKLGQQMFPAYEFRVAPRDSVIFTGEQYRATRWKPQPRLMELNNGARDLMLLVPDDDPARFFQLHQVGGRQSLYELMSDICFYTVDQDAMRFKGETYMIRPDPGAHVKTKVKIARLQYDGNWNPEPGGWTRLAAFMHNTRGIDLTVQTVRPGDGKLDKSFKVAHLTGTAMFHLSEAAEAEIRQYIEQGGTVVIDAAGGSSNFDTAAQAEIKAIVPDPSPDLLPSDHGVFSAGERLRRALYRRYARIRIGETDEFRLQGLDLHGRTALFYSAEDLTEGLVGQPIDGIYGYSPQIATSLMANIVTFAIGK